MHTLFDTCNHVNSWSRFGALGAVRKVFGVVSALTHKQLQPLRFPQQLRMSLLSANAADNARAQWCKGQDVIHEVGAQSLDHMPRPVLYNPDE